MKQWLTIMVALCCLVTTTLACSSAYAGKRVALVIGNSEYRSGVPRLPNPVNDANDTAAALRDQGFEVTEKTDLDLTGFEDALQQLKLDSADADLAMFYYAGHAVQYGGTNYLIPVDYIDGRAQYLDKRSVNMTEIRDALKDTPGAKIMVFDSCRNNPFKNMTVASRDLFGTRGLQPIQVRTGESAVLYSTRPDEVALDGDDQRNSPFSSAFIEQLKKPGRQELTTFLHQVIRNVADRTNGKQLPELVTSITGDYFLSLDNDRTEWDLVKDSNDPKVLRDFAVRFPDSKFRAQAERLAAQFQSAEEQRQREESNRLESVCNLSRRLLEMSVAARDRDGLERLASENACPKLKVDIDNALKSVTTLNQQGRCDRLDEDLGRAAALRDEVAVDALRFDAKSCPGLSERIVKTLDELRGARWREQLASEHQKLCDADSAKLEALRAGPQADRIVEIQRLGASTICDRVRDEANETVSRLRDEENKAELEAAQATLCAAEAQKLDGLVAQGSRSGIEALSRTRRCETLDIKGAIARVDDLARQHDAQALAACAAVDVGHLRASGDDKGLNDVATRCPSRRDDVATALEAIRVQRRVAEACRSEQIELRGYVVAGQQNNVSALRARATCPDLDFEAATREIDRAACDAAVAVVAHADGRNEDTLNRLASVSNVCSAARDLAGKRLHELIEARRNDDIACDRAITEAVSSRDLPKLKKLTADVRCSRRLETISAESATLLRAQQDAVTEAKCVDDEAALARVADNETALQDFARRPQMCERVRTALGERVQALLNAHDRDDRACDGALTEALSRHDLSGVQRLAADALCSRRQAYAIDALTTLRAEEHKRIADAQRKLIQAGCYNGAETGIVDAETRRALVRYWSVAHRDLPAPTAISLDLSVELEGVVGTVCSLSPAQPLAAPVTQESPKKLSKRPPGPQATLEQDAPHRNNASAGDKGHDGDKQFHSLKSGRPKVSSRVPAQQRREDPSSLTPRVEPPSAPSETAGSKPHIFY